MGNKKEYNRYLWAPEQPRVYEASPLAISGTPMSEEDAAMSLRAENLQQSLQQNPIFKSAKQWEEQQKQREKEIAASKKWLELHPEDDNDDSYTILERGKHQAIVDGKDPSYYEKMIDDGKQFTKGALSVLSLPYLGAAAAGAYGYGASLGARGLFAAQGIHGLANENGIRKTANLIKSGDYGRAALSGAGDALNAAMVIPGARFLGNVAKYGTKSAIAGDMLNQSVRYVPQSGKLFHNNETIQENRIPVGAYRQSPEQMAEKINQLNTKGFTVLGHGTGFGGQEAAKNIEREGLKIFRREGTGLVEDADITNTASFLGGPDTATKLSNWPHLNSRYISLFPSAEFRYVNGDRRYFDLFPKGTFEYIPEKKGKSFLDDVPGGWSVVKGKGGITKPSASIGYYDSKEGIFYPNPNYQYKSYSPKSNGRTYLGLLERPSKLSAAEWLGIPKGDRGNLSQEQLEALEDLRYLMGTEKVPNPKIKEFITTGVPYDETLGFRIKTPEGYFRYKPVGNRTQFSYEADNFPTDWGEANMKMYSNAREGKIILTSPYADMFSPRNPIPEGVDPTKYSKTIPKNVMKAFWKNLDENIPKGTYVSGDQGGAPLGQHLYEIWKNRNTIVPSQLDNSGNIILKRRGSSLNDFFNTLYKGTKWNARKDGLSTDSYMAILKQGNRPGHKLRFSRDGFTNFNNQGVENKHIYDLHQRMLNGEISQQDFINKFNDWVKPYNGMPAQIIDGEVVIPHPFILYKQGGILKRK